MARSHCATGAPSDSIGVSKRSRRCRTVTTKLALVFLSGVPTMVAAQDTGSCIPLKGSSACQAFDSASISTKSSFVKQYPFLEFVSDVRSFDNQIASYVQTSYVQKQYADRFGCRGVDLRNSSSMYARWTTTVLCNTLVQMSTQDCTLSANASLPVCAETCAEYAQSEAFITADKTLCASPNDDLDSLIRADFTVCGLPEQSLSGSGRCVNGADNEPANCGYGNNTIGLCSYCAAGGINSTDTCCYSSKADSRCENVKLPTVTPSVGYITATQASSSSTAPTLSTSIPSAGSAPNDSGHGEKHGLSKGAIAGIVIGSIAGVVLLALLIFLCLRFTKKRPNSQGSIFNQPSPSRKVAPVTQQQAQAAPQGYEVLPGGRIARMSALEGHSGDSPSQDSRSRANSAYNGSRKKGSDNQSSSSDYGESPRYDAVGNLRPPPMTARRHGSLSSGSVLGSEGHMSPVSVGDYSSPQQVASQQSEQLPFFKDYYSQDDIHPSDVVGVLWAYQPRAGDEFALERGDMLKVVGIWDDGWATGVMLDERAEDWEVRRDAQRDSGVSHTAQTQDPPPTATTGEMKAFPLVCVCLPQHWRKIIDGDGSTESGSTNPAAHLNVI